MKFLILLFILCASLTVQAQTAYRVRTVTSLPATCRATNPVDIVIVRSAGVNSLYICGDAANNWKGPFTIGGLTSLNSQTGATQTFVNDANVTIVSAANVHTLTWASTLGKARQHGATVYNDQANTFGAFLQKFQAGANFQLVDPTDTTKIAQFGVSGITTATTRTYTLPNANTTLVGQDTTDTLTNKNLTTPIIGSFVNATHTHEAAASGGQLNATNIFSAGTVPTARLGSGTANSTTFLRGDQTWGSPAGTGDVVGPASATDNAVARFDLATGKLVQNSVFTIDDSGNASTAGTISSGVGGSTAGFLGLGQGTAQAVVANNVGFTAPTVVTGYNLVFPAAAGDGVFLWSNAANVVTGTFQGTSGTGNFARVTSPTFTTPALGTPSAAVLTNATGLPLTTGVTGTLPVANGGLGVATLTAYAPIFGGTTGTGAVQSGTVGTAGQVLTSNGAGALPTFQAAAGGAGAWSALTNPTANLALTMGANTSTFTYNATTGAGINLFRLVDTAANTGTGYIFSAETATTSAAKPFRALALGTTGFEVNALGNLMPIGVATIGVLGGANAAIYGSTIHAGSYFTFGASSVVSYLVSTVDGIFKFQDNGSGNLRIAFGDTTASFPALKRASATVISARLGDDSNVATLNSNGADLVEGLLATGTAVDWNVTTKTNLYTVPTGKTAIITKVVVRNASVSLTTASCGFGFNALADDVIASETWVELTGSTLYTLRLAKDGSTRGAAADVFGAKCSIAQGAAATVTINVFGYIF